MFGRRRREETPAAAVEEVAQAPARDSGPWDSGEPHPERERVDLGGLRVPVGPGFEIQLNLAGDRIVGAVVLAEESALQVQAFAAPKRNGIWDEVRAELAAAVKGAGGTAEERQGPFGTELAAKVPGEGGPQPVRYLGVDGPRWFLRAAVSGRAALDADAAGILEDVVRDIVVVRGDEPMPPHESIELRLPPEARQAMDRQAEAGKPDLNPFKRGPEIAELR
ncbi:DUF3710 domain-containing protein [Planomonospora parontospora]|uniref:DUF3710 domain-containing protein n=1 Tax=Planomonospora parontospora TaxID=58119 RepID=UPI00167043B8|nr:DUF3710 domain-containing protein [Planomonospora parontospora]GGL26720.1 hypothetical protein GCM10014719_30360 [Planomonospora parontospora subsp. antibiotica]GII16135.1 hypothetical protein Ppa05_28610 [Planomonospora parontospora subsp. antibiotica]